MAETGENSEETLGEDEFEERDFEQRTSTPKKKSKGNKGMEFLNLGAGDASSIVYESQDSSDLLMTMSTIDESGFENSKIQDDSVEELGEEEESGIANNSLLRSARSVTFAAEPEIFEIIHEKDDEEEELSKYFKSEGMSNSDFWFPLDGYIFFGYLLAGMVLLNEKGRWMAEEFGMQGEGHSVSKMLVVLLFLYIYSFINWGLEGIRSANSILQLWCPNHFDVVRDWFNDAQKNVPWLGSMKVFIAPILTKMGCFFWDIIWTNYVCKSYHDKSCKMTWIGQWLFDYRNEACYDGLASSVICERFVSYLPLLFTTCTVVLMGNLIAPLISDFLQDFLSRVTLEAEQAVMEMIQGSTRGLKDELEIQSPKSSGKLIPHSETLNSSVLEDPEENESNSSEENEISDGSLNTGFLDQTEDSIRRDRELKSFATASKKNQA